MLNIVSETEDFDYSDFNSSIPKSDGLTRKSNGYGYEFGEEPSSTSKEVKHGDICNWLSLGSGVFRATGTVQPILTPGMYEIAQDQQGVFFTKLNVVTDEIFKLADSTSEKVVESIEKFWTSKDRFKKFGILHQRGIILYGPPGGGKSVSVMMIAKNVIDRGGIVINTKIPALSTQGLAQIRKIQPDIPVVNIFEDIDAMIDTYGESDLLSLLDGQNQVANCCNVATTNYPEKLDNRFKNRPSRFDEIYKIDMPNATIRRSYLTNIMVNKVDDGFIENELEKWVQDTKDFSIAHLRELVVGVHCLGSDYELVLKRLKAMMTKKTTSSDSKASLGFSAD